MPQPFRRSPGPAVFRRFACAGVFLCPTVLCQAFLAPGIQGQVETPPAVAGTVAASEDGAPITGALVVIVDQTGARVAGSLTGESGAYVVRSLPPGRYRAVAQSIGFATGSSDWFEAPGPATATIDFRLDIAPVSLEGFTVDPDRRCRTLEPGAASTIAAFWEEARKALEVARFTETEGDIIYLARVFARELDPLTLRVESSQEERREGMGRIPFRSSPPDSLAELGYVRGDGTSGWEYYAPDAEALLSPAFLNTHCMVFHEASSREDSVGIRIRPEPGREQSEVDGVLWLDGPTLKLRRLEFRYVNPGTPLEEDTPHAGGEVVFEELVNGAWIVGRWWLRMPRFRLVLVRNAIRGAENLPRVVGYREVGGELMGIWDREGNSLRPPRRPPD